MTRQTSLPIRMKSENEISESDLAPRKHKKLINVKEMTLLRLIVSIVKATKQAGDFDSLASVDKELEELASRLKVEKEEAFLLAASMEWGMSITMAGLTNYMRCSRLEAMCYEDFFDSLVKKRFMKKVGYDEDMFVYELDPEFSKDMRKNKVFCPSKVKKLGNAEFWKAVGEIYSRSEFHLFSAQYELETLLGEQKHHPFAKFCKSEPLSVPSKLFLAFAGWQLACKSVKELTKEHVAHSMDDDDNSMYAIFEDSLKGKSELAKKHLLELPCTDGMAMENTLCLPDTVIKELVGAEYVDVKQDVFIEGLISCESIPEKELFYNKEDDEVVKKIIRTLDDKNFKRIQQRMRDASFRVSYPILLYGGPGVGKTELCFQLARMTGRNIIEVKISDLRDKYVGEGQKHVQAVFDRYRNVMKNSRRCPILLLNEADGILTKRSQETDSQASKEENAMQNIILREFEKFEGILIATTNLQGNFDAAFERRFLLKLKLSEPNEETRTSIWKCMAKKLSKADAERLGREFRLSGGQIENCVRRQMIEYLLEGAKVDYKTLSVLAREEMSYKKDGHKVVGFSQG